MRRTRFWHLTAVFCGLVVYSSTAYPDEKAVVAEDGQREFIEPFESEFALDWDIIGEDKEAYSLTENAGELTLSSRYGSIWRNFEDKDDVGPPPNIFRLKTPIAPDDDFVATLQINSVDAKWFLQQIGLFAYQDNDSYLKFQLQCRHSQEPPFSLVVDTETDGKATTPHIEPQPLESPCWLRIEREDGDYKTYYSNDGDVFDWISEHSWEPAQPDEPIYIMFVLKDAAVRRQQPATVILEEFRLTIP